MARDYKVSRLRSEVSWQSSDHALPGEADRWLFVTHAAAASHRFLVAVVACRFAATIFNTELCGGLAISGQGCRGDGSGAACHRLFRRKEYGRRYRGMLCYGEVEAKMGQKKKKWSSATLATLYCYLAPSKGGNGRVPAANSLCPSHY